MHIYKSGKNSKIMLYNFNELKYNPIIQNTRDRGIRKER